VDGGVGQWMKVVCCGRCGGAVVRGGRHGGMMVVEEEEGC
jgi:hypothetical protein